MRLSERTEILGRISPSSRCEDRSGPGDGAKPMRWPLLDSGTGSRACESRKSRGMISVTDSTDQARTVGAGGRWLHVTGRGDQPFVVGANVCAGVRQ